MTSRVQRIATSDALDQAREQLTQLGTQLEDVDRRVRQLVKERPLGTLIAAALLGHVVGRLVARL
jgi:ElaB/YqjD/DUF883 family membrane-anchored ribosome-binding protein